MEADDNRLLTADEMDECTATTEQLESYLAEPDDRIAADLSLTEKRLISKCVLYGVNIAKAQRDLTASIKDARIKELEAINERHRILNGELRDTIKGKDAECQARVERIFAWAIEPCPHWADVNEKVIKRDCALCWQELKKQEGIDD